MHPTLCKCKILLSFLFCTISASSTTILSFHDISITPLFSQNTPLQSSSSHWSSFPTYGIQASVPTADNGIYLSGYALIGKLNAKNSQINSPKCVQLGIGLEREYLHVRDWFCIVGNVYLSNTSLLIAEDQGLSNAALIHSWENEYGFAVTVSPKVQIRMFEAKLPIGYGMVFSGPRMFAYAQFGLSAGVRFGKR